MKTETYKGYKISFKQYPNGFVLGETTGIRIGVFKTKYETLTEIKRHIDKIKKGWEYRRNNEYYSKEEFLKVMRG